MVPDGARWCPTALIDPDSAVRLVRPLGLGAVSSFHRGQLGFERLGLRQSLGRQQTT